MVSASLWRDGPGRARGVPDVVRARSVTGAGWLGPGSPVQVANVTSAKPGHGAEPGRSCSAQCCSAPTAAGPTRAGAAGRGLGGSCQAQRDQATSTAESARTYPDAGREWASGAAGRSMLQSGASTSRRHGSWTRMESRASCGPEEEYNLGAITPHRIHSAVGLAEQQSSLNSNRRSRYRLWIVTVTI